MDSRKEVGWVGRCVGVLILGVLVGAIERVATTRDGGEKFLFFSSACKA